MNPVQLATMKTERIAREKAAAAQNAALQQQQQQQQQQQHQQNQPVAAPSQLPQPQAAQLTQQTVTKQLPSTTPQLPAQKLTTTTQLNSSPTAAAAALQKNAALQGATGTRPSIKRKNISIRRIPTGHVDTAQGAQRDHYELPSGVR